MSLVLCLICCWLLVVIYLLLDVCYLMLDVLCFLLEVKLFVYYRNKSSLARLAVRFFSEAQNRKGTDAVEKKIGNF